MMKNREIYVQAVLNLYIKMPGTTGRICPHDRAIIRQWFARQIPIPVLETALLLGSGRRLYRRPDALKLAPIRSIAYFNPVVEELLAQPPPATYIHYLRFKLGFTTSFSKDGPG